MSRFDASRRGRILAWTGAAVAWGTAFTIGVLEPDSVATPSDVPEPPAASDVVPASRVAAMPTPPSRGLVILRYQPSVHTTTDVQTVYVPPRVPQGAPAAGATTGPAPRSSGS